MITKSVQSISTGGIVIDTKRCKSGKIAHYLFLSLHSLTIVSLYFETMWRSANLYSLFKDWIVKTLSMMIITWWCPLSSLLLSKQHHLSRAATLIVFYVQKSWDKPLEDFTFFWFSSTLMLWVERSLLWNWSFHSWSTSNSQSSMLMIIIKINKKYLYAVYILKSFPFKALQNINFFMSHRF